MRQRNTVHVRTSCFTRDQKLPFNHHLPSPGSELPTFGRVTSILSGYEAVGPTLDSQNAGKLRHESPIPARVNGDDQRNKYEAYTKEHSYLSLGKVEMEPIATIRTHGIRYVENWQKN